MWTWWVTITHTHTHCGGCPTYPQAWRVAHWAAQIEMQGVKSLVKNHTCKHVSLCRVCFGLRFQLSSFAFFLLLGHLFFSRKLSSSSFDLRLNTGDVSKGWIHPSSPFQTYTVFPSPSFPQSPPPAPALSHYSQPLHDIPIISLQSIPNPCGMRAVFLG